MPFPVKAADDHNPTLFHNRFYHSLPKADSGFSAYGVVMRQRCFKLCVCFREPGNWKHHCFLSRPALTCSQGRTLAGFCSYWAMVVQLGALFILRGREATHLIL